MQDRTPITWVKNSTNGQYYDLLKLNLSAPYFLNRRGVYVIWYTTPTGGKAIYIGQGNISERLTEHRNNPRIMQYASLGQLKVTWAEVREDLLNSIEAGLYNDYTPTENVNMFSGVRPIYVTLI